MPSIIRYRAPASSNSRAAKIQHRAVRVASFMVLVCAAALVHAQDVRKIVVFGDSLSDIGNVAHLTQSQYGVRIPGLAVDYADGRFTDGIYTVPAAQRYHGIWIEQLARMLPGHLKIRDSLDGGNDYAYGGATTGSGTGVLAFGAHNVDPVNVDNIGAQITSYLATNPKINDDTLFIVWGGAIDLLHLKSPIDILAAASNQSANIQRLIDAGATNLIIPNLPPLGLIPRLNGLPQFSAEATYLSSVYNQLLASGISVLRTVNASKDVNLRELDVFSLFNQVVADPDDFGFLNVTASSQFMPVTPDYYLFWDDLHPTTAGHHVLALRALHLLDPDHCRDHDNSGEECEHHFEHAHGDH